MLTPCLYDCSHSSDGICNLTPEHEACCVHQGLVKLADFGVAAKLGELEEANNSLRLSVVGTPYWMAPEVIEMTSVTAAADIWSVACLSIELLTGQAPYYDLQPMSALFRIVQDEHPPLPEDISPGMHNMLLQCFNKDPQKRPDAKTLLRHPWIQHNRQTLRSSWSRTQGSNATHAAFFARLCQHWVYIQTEALMR